MSYGPIWYEMRRVLVDNKELLPVPGHGTMTTIGCGSQYKVELYWSSLMKELQEVVSLVWAKNRGEELYKFNIERPTLPEDHYFYDPDVERMTDNANSALNEYNYRSYSHYLKALPVLNKINDIVQK